MGKPARDLTNMVFGKLRVLSRKDYNLYHSPVWECICECGNSHTVTSQALVAGKTISCGCMRGGVKHRLSGTPEYESWAAMRRRCINPDSPDYKDYGGRGIVICDEWLDKNNGLINFIASVGPRPSLNHSIDRYPNNDGNYEPNNCRWATAKEQANNRRNNKK